MRRAPLGPRLASRLAISVLAALLPWAYLGGSTDPARAADPVGYTASIAPTGDAALDQSLTDSSTLISLREAVTRSYFNRPEATALAKITVADGTFYHRMGDLGCFDAQGRLWFCGRKSQRVVTTSGTLFTIPCEAVFNAHRDVARTALVGVGPRGAARPILCVEMKPGRAGGDQVRLALLALGAARPHTRTIRDILFHPAFPVDIRHNAKIFREKLAIWAAKRLS